MWKSELFALSLVWALVMPVAASERESLAKGDEEEPEQIEELANLSLRDLLAVEVSSASRKLEPLSRTAAAIFVVSQEDIRRIGATNIPEALRIVPGLHVARIDSNKWAISSRGFASQFANKLLVLIDGRTVYTPLFSGVYWDAHDTTITPGSSFNRTPVSPGRPVTTPSGARWRERYARRRESSARSTSTLPLSRRLWRSDSFSSTATRLSSRKR